MIDLDQYKGAFPWTDAIIKELEESRSRNECFAKDIKSLLEVLATACCCEGDETCGYCDAYQSVRSKYHENIK